MHSHYCRRTATTATAQKIGQSCKLPSLELGTEEVSNSIDTNVGYTTLYASHISWKSPTSPLP